MSNEPISHQEIERVFQAEPDKIIARLPDCIESREAKRLAPILKDLVHHARERVRTE